MTAASAAHAPSTARYLVVFAALVALTAATIGAAGLSLATVGAVALGLGIATVKAGLVALFFMHLSHERGLVLLTLALTMVCAAALVGLTLWSEAGHAPGTRFAAPFDVAEEVR